MTNRKAERKRRITQIVAMAIAGVMIAGVVLATVLK